MPKTKLLKKSNKWLWLLAAVFIALAGFAIYYFSQKASFCANSISCINDLTGSVSPEKSGEFMGKSVDVPSFASLEAETPILGEASGVKRIEVNLTTQTLTAFQNNTPVLTFPVSTGKWSYTPTGTYQIWIKLKSTRMRGGKPGTGTYYNLPNVPYTMYFYNSEHPKIQGYGLHGAYWHNNFGHPMSHGCVNISPENAKKLYDWADPVVQSNVTYASDENPGTTIVIYGETPRE